MLTEKADGMYVQTPLSSSNAYFIRFQYVALQLEALKKAKSSEAVENVLKTLPAGLDETYNRVLLSIDLQDRGQACCALMWLAFSRRPLTIDELAEASIIDIEATPHFNEARRYITPSDLISLFPGLLVVGDTTLGNGKIIKTVAFSHFSVQEYLMSERIKQEHITPGGIKSSDAAAFHLDKKNLDLELAQSCFCYCLHIDQNKPERDELEPPFPFKDYALIMGLEHLEAIDQECWHSHLTNMALKTLEPESWLFEQVVRHNHGRAIGRFFGDDVLLNDYLDSGIKSNPLYFVVEFGYSQLTPLLIRHCVVDVNKLGGPWGTALNVAAAFGRENIVRVLLNAGANAFSHTSENNYSIRGYVCALQAAVEFKQKDIARILLQQPDTVKKCGELGYYPLVESAWDLNTSMTELLLQHGFNANERSGSTSVLQCEVGFGHLDKVKLLLQHEANVNDFEVEEIYDPIKLAVKCALFSSSYLDIIRLLLLHGAVVRKPVDEDWSKWISEGRTTELVHQDVCALYEICGYLSQWGGFNESHIDAYFEKWKIAIDYEPRLSKPMERKEAMLRQLLCNIWLNTS
jgi:hypothetical protein